MKSCQAVISESIKSQVNVIAIQWTPVLLITHRTASVFMHAAGVSGQCIRQLYLSLESNVHSLLRWARTLTRMWTKAYYNSAYPSDIESRRMVKRVAVGNRRHRLHGDTRHRMSTVEKNNRYSPRAMPRPDPPPPAAKYTL